MRRVVRWCKAPGADGICAGSRFSAVQPFPDIPDFPEFPSLPHRLPTPLTLRQVSGSLQRSVPGMTFIIKDSVMQPKQSKHKSFSRFPKPTFQFYILVFYIYLRFSTVHLYHPQYISPTPTHKANTILCVFCVGQNFS